MSRQRRWQRQRQRQRQRLAKEVLLVIVVVAESYWSRTMESYADTEQSMEGQGGRLEPGRITPPDIIITCILESGSPINCCVLLAYSSSANILRQYCRPSWADEAQATPPPQPQPQPQPQLRPSNVPVVTVICVITIRPAYSNTLHIPSTPSCPRCCVN